MCARGKARHSLAKSQMAKAASDEEAKAAAHAGWRKSLHDLQSASYHDESSLEPFLVRAEVLQVKAKCRWVRVESGVTVSIAGV